MKQNAIREFKLWSVCMAAGVVVLASEVAVKARRPAVDSIPAATFAPANAADELISPPEAIPEEVVADLLVDAVIQVESAGNPRTVGKKGERGLMQIKQATWTETTRRMFGKPVPFGQAFDPALNVKVGKAYLAYLHQFLQSNRQEWQADERSLLLASYNAGPQRVAAAGFNVKKLPASTRDYVQRASALHDVYLNKHAMRLEPGQGRGIMQIVRLPGERDS